VARDILGQVTVAPLISHRFALEEAADAYRMLDERPDEAVQAVFTYV
jgi:threonine dehydrogenase-like Zn-dependent dehydrogenase